MRRLLLLPCLVFASLTCSRDVTGPPGPPSVARIVLSTHLDSVFVGDTLRLTAVGLDSRGDTLRGRAVRWRSSDTAKLSVDSTGLITARLAGSVAVTVSIDTATAGAFVTAQWPVVAVALPDSFTLTRYEVVRLIPAVRGPTGTQLADRGAIWTTSNPAVATVSAIGVVQPQGIGAATITVSAAGHEDSSRLFVIHEPVQHLTLQVPGGPPVPTGVPDTLGVTCTDTLLRDAVGAPVAWSLDTTVFRIAVAPGNDRVAVLTGRHPGSSLIKVACGGLTDSTWLATDLPPALARFSPETLVIGVGQLTSPDGILLDTAGGAHGPAFFTIQSLDTTIIGVVSGQIVGRKPGRARITGVTNLGTATAVDTGLVIVPADSIRLAATWGINPPLSIENYSVFVGQVTVSDTAGHPLASPRTISLSTGDTSVGRFEPASIATRDTGTFKLWVGHAGHTVASIRLDSVTASRAIISTNAPVANIVLTGPAPSPLSGDTFTIGANLVGEDGRTRFYPVTWTPSDSTIIRIDTLVSSLTQTAQTARFTALRPGRVTIKIASANLSQTVPFLVRSSAGLTVTGASVVMITPGIPLTLSGSGFDAGDSVWLDGVPAPVTAAAATSLTVLVPPASAFRCQPTHLAAVVVSGAGGLVIDSVPLRVGIPESLSIGGLVRLPPGSNRCTEILSADQVYEVAFTNGSSSPDEKSTVEVVGQSSAQPPSAAPPSRPLAVARGAAASASLDSAARSIWAHRQFLQANRAVAQRLGPPQRWWGSGPGPARPALSVGATIGGIAHIRIPNIAVPDFCSSYIGVDARLVYSGAHSQIFEDITAPNAHLMDSIFTAVGREFDSTAYPELLADFGNPLAMDSLLDRVGKISMVFSPAVNAFNVGGFVTSCDFYPESAAPSSNTTEIFYGPVPTATSGGFVAYSPEAWKWQIRTVLMHESKHITSYAERFSRQAPLEETWLEESSAVLSEELWSRAFYHSTWKGNVSYRSSIYCDVRPDFPECAGQPFSMFNAFDFLYAFDETSRQHSPLGPTSPGDATFYGSGWSFLRWAIDRYAGSEAGFLRTLTQEPSLTGGANLAARTGQPLGQMLADWQLSLMASGVAGLTPADPAIGFPSWNLPSIYAGMAGDFPSLFPDLFPEQLAFTQTFYATDDTITLAGGETTVYLLSAFPGSFTFEIKGSGGGPPPALQLEILRLH